jgi:8-hydroxy-5-deazaflavin:NADPH oxidoreductase
MMSKTSTTAIVGVGNIGGALARHLSRGGESIVLAAKDRAHAEAVADQLGPRARAASIEDAITATDAVVFALWLDPLREVIQQWASLLEGKVVVDPTNPIGFDNSGNPMRTLPEGQSAGAIVAGLLPSSAHYVKAFGTLAADALAGAALREPRRAALFYATDDDLAAATIERLMRVAGFDPLKAGGLKSAGRIEAPGGDLHQFGLNGEIVDLDQARAALAGASDTGERGAI